jgi:hypothetical protein
LRLHERLNRLERNRPSQSQDMLWLDLPDCVSDRFDAAKAADTFPDGLSFDDMMVIYRAAEVARGKIGRGKEYEEPK